MMTDVKIKNSSELEFAVFCIENVAAKLGVDAERVYQAFTEQSDILNSYIVPGTTRQKAAPFINRSALPLLRVQRSTRMLQRLQKNLRKITPLLWAERFRCGEQRQSLKTQLSQTTRRPLMQKKAPALAAHSTSAAEFGAVQRISQPPSRIRPLTAIW